MAEAEENSDRRSPRRSPSPRERSRSPSPRERSRSPLSHDFENV